jgi:hypothetical protein
MNSFTANGLIDIGYEPSLNPKTNFLGAESLTLALNLAGSFATNSQLATGGPLQNVGSIGPIVGFGLGLSSRVNTLVEAGVSVAHGSPASAGGQSGTVVTVHVGIGVTLSSWGNIDGKGTYSIGLEPFFNYENDGGSNHVSTKGINISLGFRTK